MTIRAAIVDDEPLARARIRDLLRAHEDIRVIGEYGDPGPAVLALRSVPPDLLFLDIQMPGMDGFDLLRAIGRSAVPVVVFVTAFDEYAVQAFDVHAFDYLLKPFDEQRFDEALQRAREHLGASDRGELTRRLLELLSEVRPNPTYLERVALRSPGRVTFLKTEEIDWVEGEGNYLRLHSGGFSHLLRETMNDFGRKLDPARFLRIHRSSIVNLDRIQRLEPLPTGAYAVLLTTGARLTLSRGYRDALRALTGE